MTEEEIQSLKALAEEVKQWGNCNQAWIDNSEDAPAAVVGHIDEDGNCYPVVTIDCDQYYAAQDSIKLARFYASANPEDVLALIAESAALRAAIEEAERVLRSAGCDMTADACRRALTS
jgi:hypothetical protein